MEVKVCDIPKSYLTCATMFFNQVNLNKMSKIIIKNQTEMDDISVLTLVQRVIKNGRISNNGKQYCYLTSFEIENKEYHIVTDLRKCSDVFTFYAVS